MAARKPKTSYRWEVSPYAGVGPIRFMMTRAEVRALIRGKAAKDMPADSPSDTFEEISAQIFYNAESDQCELIEFTGTNGGPELNGRGLLGRPYERALTWLESLDSKVVSNSASCRSPSFGMILHAEGAEEDPSVPIHRIGVFAKSYRPPEG